MSFLASLLRGGKRMAFAGGIAAFAAASYPYREVHSSVLGSEPLDPSEWHPLKLVSNAELTQGGPTQRPTRLLRFELPETQAALPVASCLLVRAPVGSVKEDGTRAFVLRPYTPVSRPDARHLDLALKIYADGKLTPHLAGLKPGDALEFKGPLPKLPIEEAAKRTAIGMVAGGTGVTPMLQLADELLRTGYKGQLSLVYANVSPEDIMLKGQLDQLAAQHSNFKVYYVVDKVATEQAWTGGVGYVTAELLRKHLPPPSDSSLVLVCGPPGMMKSLSGEKLSPKEQGPLSGLLADPLGYNASQVFKF